ncbi:MAG TPA: flagellar basal body-associated FliL family protein [Caulobacteraceae bacterium]|nr:flagellar basal body-associated FliL family protein [Caulobacteraceae bacterium]
MSSKKDKDKDAATEVPEGAEGEAGAEGGKKKLPLKLIIIGAVGAVVVLGGGGAGALILLGGKGKPADAHAAKKPDKKAAHGKEGEGKDPKAKSPITQGPDGVVFYAMPDLVVNIQAADSRPTFLKLKLAFELPNEEAAEQIEPNQPRLADMFQTFLRELRPEDLSGSQGSYQLRMEILRRVNLVIAPAKVNAVLIQEMLIQ